MTADGPQRCHWEVDLAIVYIAYINGIVKGLIERGALHLLCWGFASAAAAADVDGWGDLTALRSWTRLPLLPEQGDSLADHAVWRSLRVLACFMQQLHELSGGGPCPPCRSSSNHRTQKGSKECPMSQDDDVSSRVTGQLPELPEAQEPSTASPKTLSRCARS